MLSLPCWGTNNMSPSLLYIARFVMLNILHIIIYCHHSEQSMMVQSYHFVDDFIFQASPWVAGKDVDCKAMSGSGRPGPSHSAETVHKINLWEMCEFLRELLWISNFHLSADYIFVAKVMRRFTPFLQTEATRMVSTEAGLGLGVVHPSLLLPSPEQWWFEYEAFCV